MRYKNMFTGQLEKNTFDDEFKNSRLYDSIRLGDKHIFKTEIIGVKYAAYSQLDRAFLRKIDSNCKTCCSSYTMTTPVLVLAMGDKEVVFMQEEETIRKMLEDLGRQGVSIGK